MGCPLPARRGLLIAECRLPRPDYPLFGSWHRLGRAVRLWCWPGRADHLEDDWTETELEVILRRLADLPLVKGNVRTATTGPLEGMGVSRYQRQSAHLRDRDCSIELSDSDDLGVDLTKD